MSVIDINGILEARRIQINSQRANNIIQKQKEIAINEALEAAEKHLNDKEAWKAEVKTRLEDWLDSGHGRQE